MLSSTEAGAQTQISNAEWELVVIEPLSDGFDFFFQLELLAFHCGELHGVARRVLALIFYHKIKFAVAKIEFIQPLLDGH